MFLTPFCFLQTVVLLSFPKDHMLLCIPPPCCIYQLLLLYSLCICNVPAIVLDAENKMINKRSQFLPLTEHLFLLVRETGK